MADADSPQRAAGAAAKPRTGAAAKPRTSAAAKPRTGTGTAAEPGADAAAEPRADAAGEPGTGGGARGRAGLKIHHLRPAPGAHTARTRVGRGEAGQGKPPGRGTKGTKARGQGAPGFAGRHMPLQRTVPELTGFPQLPFQTPYHLVNTRPPPAR